MKSFNVMWLGLLAVCGGCRNSQVAESNHSPNGDTHSAYLADKEPSGAMPVGEARQVVQDDQAVVLVGRIGGSSQPFVDGIAAFTIVDPSVPHCAPEEGCPTPWDYCCTQDQVVDNIATVKLVDEGGQVVASDARDVLGVEELAMVVVEGTAARDEQGNLTLSAKHVFVRPGQ